jgi:hypothetical protein
METAKEPRVAPSVAYGNTFSQGKGGKGGKGGTGALRPATFKGFAPAKAAGPKGGTFNTFSGETWKNDETFIGLVFFGKIYRKLHVFTIKYGGFLYIFP